jgi:Immunity protein 53
MDLLQALQDWYARQCDGDWEHDHGVTIESLDNPGWLVMISLGGTKLQLRPFRPITGALDAGGFPDDARWLRCYTKDDVWHGAGDETQLPVILRTFLSWASPDPDYDEVDDVPPR